MCGAWNRRTRERVGTGKRETYESLSFSLAPIFFPLSSFGVHLPSIYLLSRAAFVLSGSFPFLVLFPPFHLIARLLQVWREEPRVKWAFSVRAGVHTVLVRWVGNLCQRQGKRSRRNSCERM